MKFLLMGMILVLGVMVRSGICKIENSEQNRDLKSSVKTIYTKSRLPAEFKRIYAQIANDVYQDYRKQGPIVGPVPVPVPPVPPSVVKKKLALLLAASLGKASALKAFAILGGLIKKLTVKFAAAKKSIVGRCFGVARRLKIVIPLVIFKLGVIVTTLAFLTIFSLKSLAIGVILLIINVSKVLAKFLAVKGGHGGLGHHPVDNGVHYHIHAKGGSPHYKYHPPKIEETFSTGYGWRDRLSERLGQTASAEERQELLDMYQRIGLARSSRERVFITSDDIPMIE